MNGLRAGWLSITGFRDMGYLGKKWTVNLTGWYSGQLRIYVKAIAFIL